VCCIPSHVIFVRLLQPLTYSTIHTLTYSHSHALAPHHNMPHRTTHPLTLSPTRAVACASHSQVLFGLFQAIAVLPILLSMLPDKSHHQKKVCPMLPPNNNNNTHSHHVDNKHVAAPPPSYSFVGGPGVTAPFDQHHAVVQHQIGAGLSRRRSSQTCIRTMQCGESHA
jgi:hypothetical protein